MLLLVAGAQASSILRLSTSAVRGPRTPHQQARRQLPFSPSPRRHRVRESAAQPARTQQHTIYLTAV